MLNQAPADALLPQETPAAAEEAPAAVEAASTPSEQEKALRDRLADAGRREAAERRARLEAERRHQETADRLARLETHVVQSEQVTRQQQQVAYDEWFKGLTPLEQTQERARQAELRASAAAQRVAQLEQHLAQPARTAQPAGQSEEEAFQERAPAILAHVNQLLGLSGEAAVTLDEVPPETHYHPSAFEAAAYALGSLRKKGDPVAAKKAQPSEPNLDQLVEERVERKLKEAGFGRPVSARAASETRTGATPEDVAKTAQKVASMSPGKRLEALRAERDRAFEGYEATRSR